MIPTGIGIVTFGWPRRSARPGTARYPELYRTSLPDRPRLPPPMHARQADGPAPALDQPPRDREPQAGSARRGGKRRIEDAREDVGGDAAAVVLHSEPAPVLRDTYRHAPGARIAGVLEQVDEDLLHFVPPGGRGRAGRTRELDRGLRHGSAERVQVHDLARHGMDVDGLERERLRRRRCEAGERARDRVQPVDFGQDPAGRLRQRRVEIPAVLLVARALEMLDAEPDRSEGILDLVGHLPA